MRLRAPTARGSLRCGGRSGAAGRSIVVPHHRVERVHVSLEPAAGQAPPTVVARLSGTVEPVTYEGDGTAAHRGAPARFTRTFELVLKDGRYVITASRGAPESREQQPSTTSDALGGVRLQDVAAQVGLDFTQDAFHFEATNEPDAMMGGGLCWIDYDADGWLDLYAVNAYADDEYVRWTESGGLPRSALFHNVKGRFVDVSRGSGADLPLRGNGCVAATSTRTGTRTCSSRPPGTTSPPTATTRCSGGTGTAPSSKAPARPGSTTRAGTPVPRSAT